MNWYLLATKEVEPADLSTTCCNALPFLCILLEPVVHGEQLQLTSLRVQDAAGVPHGGHGHREAIDDHQRRRCPRHLP
jgi:hypothetical protein